MADGERAELASMISIQQARVKTPPKYRNATIIKRTRPPKNLGMMLNSFIEHGIIVKYMMAKPIKNSRIELSNDPVFNNFLNAPKSILDSLLCIYYLFQIGVIKLRTFCVVLCILLQFTNISTAPTVVAAVKPTKSWRSVL